MREKLHMDELIVKIKQSKATVPVLVILGMLLFLSLLLSIGLRTNKRDIVNTSEVQRQEMLTEMNQVKDYLTTLDTSVERYLTEELTSISNLVENSSADMDSSFQQGITNLKSEMKTLQTSIETTQNELNNLYTTVENNDGENSQVMNQEFTVVKNSIASLNEDFKDAHENVETLIKALNEDLDSYYEENKKDLEKYFADQKADLEAYFGEDKQESVSQNQLLEDKFLEQSSNVESLNQKLDESLSSQEQLIEENFQQQTLHIDEVYVELQGILETMSTDMETLLKEQFTQMMDTLTEMEDTYLATMEDYHNKTIWTLDAMNDSMTSQHDDLTAVISNQYRDMTTTINNSNTVQQESLDSLMTYLDQKLNQVFTFVSDGKKKIVSALLTKGVDISEDATFTQIYEAVMSIEQELLIGVEQVPGEVTYEYHYHVDGAGEELHSSTCSIAQMGGCYTMPLYHCHTDAYGYAQTAGYKASSEGGCFVNPTYHAHTGSSSRIGGCYSVANTKVCGNIVQLREFYRGHSCHGGCISYYEIEYGCSNCRAVTGWRCGGGGNSCGNMGGQVTGQHSSTTYSLGCGKTTSTVEGYLLGCNKTTETLEAYQTGCGLSDGQIVGAMIVYDQSAIQTMANMSMPRPVAEPMSLPVMENDSNNSIPEMVPEDENANEEQETVVSEEVNNIPEEIPEEETIVEEAPLEDVETQEPPEVTPESELPNVEEPTTDIEPEETFSEEAVEEITENNTEGGDG